MLDPQLRAEISWAMARLEYLAKDLKREARSALRAGGKIIVQEIQDRAPVGKKPHSRYKKSATGKRAAPGQGLKVATYYPGNLEKSFGLMTFRRSEAVFVGPRTGNKAKASGGYDGYYAHMVDRGTRYARADNFVKPAVAASEKEATDLIVRKLKQKIEKYNDR